LSLFTGDIRQRYWTLASHFALARVLLRPLNREVARHAAWDCFRYIAKSVQPIEGETGQRASAAAGWLLRAQDATPDDGVSLGYFPCDQNGTNGWRLSYPETTGYIIPTLLEFARRFKEEEIWQRALRMANWEMTIQMPSGAVQSGPLCSPDRQVPAVFNTGMVLLGYSAAYRATQANEFLTAGRRAADFLLNDIDDEGHFKTHGTFVVQHRYKTYNSLCAWPLYLFGEDVQDERYLAAATRVIEAAIEQQQPNGWFANNCFTNSEAALTHTICYVLQGILEVGALARRKDFLAAAQGGAEPLLQRISREGFLAGSFDQDWQRGMYSSCLTGNAQLAVVCYRLHQETGVSRYKMAADRLVNYLKAFQDLHSDNPAINGAIPGSFPFLGSYMTAGYPSWATKYFLDALLLQERLGK